MATAPSIHTRYVYSPQIASHYRINGSQQRPSYSSSSSSSSSSSYSASNFSSIFLSAGRNRGQRKHSVGPQAMSTATQGNSIAITASNINNGPEHLLVLVHGIMSSSSDWTYTEAELTKHLGKNFLIYASSSNTYTKTFSGIDEAGKRLADEVMQVVKKTKSLKRISFLAHSLGGLFARYAVAVLYSPDTSTSGQLGDPQNCTMENSERTNFSKGGLIAGLEPINFITLATPHLGVRGKNQLPFLFGVTILEKIAAPVASLFVGQTGTQLFLTDGNPNKPPLLLRMASDCEDGKFISALGTFRFRTVYANVSYDHMVGWRTSSIRRETELGKPPSQFLDGYKHVVDVKYCTPVPSDGSQFTPRAMKAKETAQNASYTENTVEYHQIMEEEMIRGLQQLGWKKVDVNFRSATLPFFAHYNIHVKNERLHNAGVGVIAHVADSLRQSEATILAPSF
ncbi:uncharacterized protein [Arachis hypogaea]|nr:uncharacterized protein LOC112714482 isoform X1 [Arachis hypogaea]